jgi:hypothetical protein
MKRTATADMRNELKLKPTRQEGIDKWLDKRKVNAGTQWTA